MKPTPSDENTQVLTKDSTNQQKPVLVTEKNLQTLPKSAGKFIPVVQAVPVHHYSGINAMTYGHDGQLLAIIYDDNVIRLFKVVDDRFYLLRVFVGDTAKVTSIVFDPQGQFLTSYDKDDIGKSWEVKTGKLLPNVIGPKQEIEIEEAYSFSGEKPPVIAIDSQGRYQASRSSFGIIELVEINSGKQLFSLNVNDKYCEESGITSCDYDVGFLIFDPQGKRLVSGGGDLSVTLWEIPSGKLLFTLTGQERPIGAIAFDGQGLQLASGINYLSGLMADKTKVNSTLKVWEVLSGKLLVLPQDYPVESLSLDGQGQRLAISLDEGREVKMWEVPSNKLLLELSRDEIGLGSVAFDPQGKYLAAYTESLIVWEIPTEEQRRISTTLHEELPHDEDWVKSITFENYSKGYDGLCPVTFDPQGRYLVGGVMIWEVSSKQLVHTLPEDTGRVAFDQEGKLMVGAVGNTVNWWEVGSWKLLQTLTLNESENLNESEKKVTFMAIDPQGKRIVGRLDDKNRNCYDFCTGVVTIWDATNGSLLSTFQHVGSVTSAAFTRNGQYLAVAGSEGYIAFYEVTTGQRFLSLHSLDNGGKLILLADGRFDGDEKGMEYLRYTEQGTLNSYSAKELKAQFFQPAAVKEALQKVGGK